MPCLPGRELFRNRQSKLWISSALGTLCVVHYVKACGVLLSNFLMQLPLPLMSSGRKFYAVEKSDSLPVQIKVPLFEVKSGK